MPVRIAILVVVLAGCWTVEESTSPQSATSPVASTPLAPVKTDSPRDTMRSFMEAMERHLVTRTADPQAAESWLDDAVRCLDLTNLPVVDRDAAARESAVALKEVIDRVIAIDYSKVPDDAALTRWRLRGTEITVVRIESGDRKGEFTISADSVLRARGFFNRIKHLPLLPGKTGGGWVTPWQERFVPAGLKDQVFGVAYWQWVLLGALVFVGIFIRQITRFAAFLVRRMTARTNATWDDELVDVLTSPATYLATTGVWFASLHLLGISGPAYTVIALLIKTAFFVSLGYLAYRLAGFVGMQLEFTLRQRQKDLNQGLCRLIRQTLQLLALVFCLLLGAQNMGMDVASLIAGLGIGGLAFALAAKDTLANLLGSVMIMIDRPFRIGDYIVAKGTEGTVEEIGFRSTRIRTPHNSVMSIPNSELVLANIDNMGMREYRRVRENLGLECSTSPTQIEAFCAGIRAILQANVAVRQDAITVACTTMGASSLDVLINYHLQTATWNEELSQRQQILMQILVLAKERGVAFAYPTQVMHVASLPGTISGLPAPA